MIKLSTVLANMPSSSSEPEPLQPMQPLGSTTNVGPLTIVQSAPNEQQHHRKNQAGEARQTASAPTSTLGHSADEIKQLTQALGIVCELQKSYGKQPGDLVSLVNGYVHLLAEFPMPEILKALKAYMLKKSDIPHPADIANIIQPSPVPLSGAVYFEYKRKSREGAYLLQSERDYCSAYEAQEQAKCPGGSPELRQYQAKLEQHEQVLRLEYGE